jgi:hypothetical protein
VRRAACGVWCAAKSPYQQNNKTAKPQYRTTEKLNNLIAK